MPIAPELRENFLLTFVATRRVQSTENKKKVKKKGSGHALWWHTAHCQPLATLLELLENLIKMLVFLCTNRRGAGAESEMAQKYHFKVYPFLTLASCWFNYTYVWLKFYFRIPENSILVSRLPNIIGKEFWAMFPVPIPIIIIERILNLVILDIVSLLEIYLEIPWVSCQSGKFISLLVHNISKFKMCELNDRFYCLLVAVMAYVVGIPQCIYKGYILGDYWNIYMEMIFKVWQLQLPNHIGISGTLFSWSHGSWFSWQLYF